MGRLSAKAKMKYTRIEGENPDACYYCQETTFVMMDDTTPSHKIPEEMQMLFEGEWTIARCCNNCWARINGANLIRGAKGYDGIAGLMTVEHKALMINGVDLGVGAKSQAGKMYIDKGRKVLPAGCGIDLENGSVFVNTKKFTAEEIDLLQGVMAMRFIGASDDAIERVLAITVAGGDLEVTLDMGRKELYRMMLGLIDDPDIGKGF